MKVTFVGVGEAFDVSYGNTSILLEHGDASILLDCGFSVATAYWALADNPAELDGLYFSHFHGDHIFGVPQLILKLVSERRTKPFIIVGQSGVQDTVMNLLNMAYPGLLEKAHFTINFLECRPGESLWFESFQLGFAEVTHGRTCLGISVTAGGKKVFYSGDGRPTQESLRLCHGCQLVIHESYSESLSSPNHSSFDEVVEFGLNANAPEVALVHIKASDRQRLQQLADSFDQSRMRVFVPEPGESLEL